jgi:hypothetical protein
VPTLAPFAKAGVMLVYPLFSCRRRLWTGAAARCQQAYGLDVTHLPFLAHGRSFAPGARMRIGFTSEQESNPESRVLLSDKADALGIRRSNVRWQLTGQTLRTMREYAKVLRE